MPLFYGDNPLPFGCRWTRPTIPDREHDRQVELAEAVTDYVPPKRRKRPIPGPKTVGARRAEGAASLDPPDPLGLRSR